MSCICLYLKVMITRDLLNNSMQALPRNMEGNCTVFSSKSFDDKGCSFRVLLKTSWGKEKKNLNSTAHRWWQIKFFRWQATWAPVLIF